MAGRLILIALSCAISGLFVDALTTATSPPILVQKKPAGIGLCLSGSGHISSEGGPAVDVALPVSLKAGIESSGPERDDDQAGRRTAGETSPGKLKQRDPAIMISVESLLRRQRAKEDITLIDVRDHSVFEKCHIEGSLNVPLYAVRTKKFLKSTILVLINEGFRYTKMAEQCKRLREAGFMVWMLEGGLNAWREAGASFVADDLSVSDLNKVSAQDLFAEKNSAGWVAIDGRKSKQAEDVVPLLGIVPVVSLDNRGEITPSIAEFVKIRGEKRVTIFVLFNDDGRCFDSLEKAVRNTGIRNLFFLRDGLAGYRAFLASQEALSTKHDGSKKTVLKCPNCP